MQCFAVSVWREKEKIWVGGLVDESRAKADVSGEQRQDGSGREGAVGMCIAL